MELTKIYKPSFLCIFLFYQGTHWVLENGTWLISGMVAQSVKNLPAMQETGLQSLGWEGHLEEGREGLGRRHRRPGGEKGDATSPVPGGISISK